jgi:uncharacterized protein (TIGR03089 family)
MPADLPAPSMVPDLLARLLAGGGQPRITWYGEGGERVELSGAVLANWVAKTTNLLVEEFDVAPATRVRLDLPPHWRTLVWALATWRAGGCVVLADADADDADVVVTDRPDAHPGGDLVAVALPALARRFDGPLPAGAIDAAAAVMTYGDVIGWAPEADPGAPAVDVDGAPVRHADLTAWSAGTPAATPGARALLTGGRDRSGDVAGFLRDALGVLATDGSLVVLAADVARELEADPVRRDRLLQTERVTLG